MIEPTSPMFDLILACSDYASINVSLFRDGSVGMRDAVICAYTARQGLTMPMFGSIVMLGIFNIPIYIRQESALVPFVLAVLLSGILLSSVSGFVQGIIVIITLFVVGLGPLLVLLKVDRG